MAKSDPAKLFLVFALLLAILIALVWFQRWRREHRFDQEIEAAASKYAVDKFLLKALVWRESWFDPGAESSRGALGLAQVLPGTGEDWAKATKRTDYNLTDLFQPTANLEAGAWYLARALKFWASHGEEATVLALAEYNAGRTNVVRWMANQKTASQPILERIGYSETQRYVSAILAKAEQYRQRGHL